MRRTFLLKTMLLLCALVAGSSSVWADDYTDSYTATFADKPTATNGTTSGTVIGTNSISWSYSVTQETKSSKSPYSAFAEASGWQLGSGNSPCKAFSISTSGISGTITQIQVVTGSANASSSINVTVGGAAFGTQGQATGSGSSVSTQTFNGSASGEIVITASASTAAFYFKSVTVTYSTNTKEANGITWSANSKDVTYSETPYNLPTLTNPHTLSIIYDSSNKSVATIDNDGKVTINNVTGSTTISASTPGDDTYAAGTVTYTLNVTKKVIVEDGIFNFGMGEDYGSGAVYKTTSNIDMTETTWTAVNVKLDVAGRNIWEESSGSLKLYYKSSGQATSGNITLSCPADKYITNIAFTGVTGTGNLSNIETTVGDYVVSGASSTWRGVAKNVTFTAKNSTYIKTITVTYGDIPTVDISTLAGRNYASYVTTWNLDFKAAEGIKAYIATGFNDGGTAIVLKEVDVVPAKTAIIVKTETQGATINVSATTAAASDVSANKLVAGDGATAWNGTDGYTYYFLKEDQFHQATSGTLQSGKAYFKVLTSEVPANGAPALGFDLGEGTTGISLTPNPSPKGEGSIYTLDGRRVENPTKGLYIINGKKVIIK